MTIERTREQCRLIGVAVVKIWADHKESRSAFFFFDKTVLFCYMVSSSVAYRTLLVRGRYIVHCDELRGNLMTPHLSISVNGSLH